MLYVRCPLSLRNEQDLLHERGIEICHETVRSSWVRLPPHVNGQDDSVLALAAAAEMDVQE